MAKESKFQAALIKELKDEFKDCEVLKNDSDYKQGIPDLTIFYEDKWAMLECKKSKSSIYQNNQEYYLDKMNRLSYASRISPENKEEILSELREKFKKKKRGKK